MARMMFFSRRCGDCTRSWMLSFFVYMLGVCEVMSERLSVTETLRPDDMYVHTRQ